MRHNYYVETADGGVSPCGLKEWGEMFDDIYRRRVALTQVRNFWAWLRHPFRSDEHIFRVSTVFMGSDHGFGDGPPLLYETMIFGGLSSYLDLYCERYSTRAEAEEGHRRAVKYARSFRFAQALA